MPSSGSISKKAIPPSMNSELSVSYLLPAADPPDMDPNLDKSRIFLDPPVIALVSNQILSEAFVSTISSVACTGCAFRGG